MRSWGVMNVNNLTEWLRSHGLPATRPGQHFSTRAQEAIIQEGCRTDARVALLETVLVLTALHQRRASGVPQVTRTIPWQPPRRPGVLPIPEAFAQEVGNNWTARICLSGSRCESMLKTCLFFFRGRLRQSFTVALRERYRARQVEDTQAEERAWKLFGLIPIMLMHCPKTRAVEPPTCIKASGVGPSVPEWDATFDRAGFSSGVQDPIQEVVGGETLEDSAVDETRRVSEVVAMGPSGHESDVAAGNEIVSRLPSEVQGPEEDSESDIESIPGIDRRTRRRLSLVWTAHVPDAVPMQNSDPPDKPRPKIASCAQGHAN